MRHLGTQILKTERLTLRPFQLDDAQAMFENWASREAVTRTTQWKRHESVFETEGILSAWCALYDDVRIYNWAIVLPETGQAIGNIACVDFSERDARCTVGYCLSDKYWNQGLTTEALGAVLEFLFQKVGVRKVESYHAVDNPSSGRVMEKNGMKREGTLRAHLLGKDGAYHDLAVWGLLAEEAR